MRKIYTSLVVLVNGNGSIFYKVFYQRNLILDPKVTKPASLSPFGNMKMPLVVCGHKSSFSNLGVHHSSFAGVLFDLAFSLRRVLL